MKKILQWCDCTTKRVAYGQNLTQILFGFSWILFSIFEVDPLLLYVVGEQLLGNRMKECMCMCVAADRLKSQRNLEQGNSPTETWVLTIVSTISSAGYGTLSASFCVIMLCSLLGGYCWSVCCSSYTTFVK